MNITDIDYLNLCITRNIVIADRPTVPVECDNSSFGTIHC